MAAIDEREIERWEQMYAKLERELAQAKAELAAERSNRVVAEAHWRDNMEVLQLKLESAERRAEEAERLLRELSARHDWMPNLGQCACKEHVAARAYLNAKEGT